jgi:hypothetical protein
MAQSEGTGLFQFLKWGSGSSADTGTGIITGGSVGVSAEPRVRTGIGGVSVRRGGLITPRGSADMYVTGGNAGLIAEAFRDSYPRGDLSKLVIEGGADEWSLAYSTALIETLSFTYSQGEGLRASIAWGALEVDEGSGSSQIADSSPDFEDYEFTCKIGGAEYGVTDFTCAIDNHISWLTAADTKTAGKKRLPTHAVVGAETSTASITTSVPILKAALGWLADCPTEASIVLDGTNCSGDQVTVTLTNLMVGDIDHSFVDGDSPYGWDYSFVGSTLGSVQFTFTAGGGSGS